MDRKAVALFLTFLKIGAFTFGGGYAMIPLIKRELVDNKKWISDEDIVDIIAIAESTPGPIAVNSATFVGYKVCGFLGAFFSTLGVVLPSFVIVSVISLVLDAFKNITAVSYAFFGIRAGVLALIVNAFLMMLKKCPKNFVAYFVAFAAFLFATFSDVNVIFIIIGSGLVGLCSYMLAKGKEAK